MMTNHYDAKMEGLNLTTIGFLEFSLLRHDIFKSIAHVWTIGLYIVEAFQDIFSANLSYSEIGKAIMFFGSKVHI